MANRDFVTASGTTDSSGNLNLDLNLIPGFRYLITVHGMTGGSRNFIPQVGDGEGNYVNDVLTPLTSDGHTEIVITGTGKFRGNVSSHAGDNIAMSATRIRA